MCEYHQQPIIKWFHATTTTDLASICKKKKKSTNITQAYKDKRVNESKREYLFTQFSLNWPKLTYVYGREEILIHYKMIDTKKLQEIILTSSQRTIFNFFHFSSHSNPQQILREIKREWLLIFPLMRSQLLNVYMNCYSTQDSHPKTFNPKCSLKVFSFEFARLTKKEWKMQILELMSRAGRKAPSCMLCVWVHAIVCMCCHVQGAWGSTRIHKNAPKHCQLIDLRIPSALNNKKTFFHIQHETLRYKQPLEFNNLICNIYSYIVKITSIHITNLPLNYMTKVSTSMPSNPSSCNPTYEWAKPKLQKLELILIYLRI